MRQPMLAATLTEKDLPNLPFPLYGSPKIDGIRATCYNGALLSRSMKPIPNRTLQDLFSHRSLHGLDGELVIGNVRDKGAFNRTTSAVMSYDGDVSNVTYYVFDLFRNPRDSYYERLAALHAVVDFANHPKIQVLAQRPISNPDELLVFEVMCLEAGYEGVMLRNPDRGYKFGRSTLREQALMKLKRFTDCETVIVGYEELMSNQNEATISESGYQTRSSHQANLVPQGVLGALVCNWEGKPFKIGTGFTFSQRQSLWAHKELLVGMKVTFKYLTYGMKDVPRLPVSIGIRAELDM